jgi:bacterioferritin-associated ferredoxin
MWQHVAAVVSDVNDLQPEIKIKGECGTCWRRSFVVTIYFHKKNFDNCEDL